jgi:hypothetical protein
MTLVRELRAHGSFASQGPRSGSKRWVLDVLQYSWVGLLVVRGHALAAGVVDALSFLSTHCALPVHSTHSSVSVFHACICFAGVQGVHQPQSV